MKFIQYNYLSIYSNINSNENYILCYIKFNQFFFFNDKTSAYISINYILNILIINSLKLLGKIFEKIYEG